jgi:hypothetical protein
MALGQVSHMASLGTDECADNGTRVSHDVSVQICALVVRLPKTVEFSVHGQSFTPLYTFRSELECEILAEGI